MLMASRVLIVESPAKVNLHLGIGAKRPDGYHDLQTVFHTLALSDTLTFTLHEAGDGFQAPADSLRGVSLSSEPAFDFPLAKNLVFRALDALATALGRPIVEPGQHLHIHVQKRIPAQAGLGGGSSNAAAALLAACELWGVDPLGPLCLEVAGKLGADVAFFLYGGCAFMDGKGEVMRERFEQAAQAVDLPERVPLEREAVRRVARSHKIRTDTGIEVTFPAEYSRNPEFITFTSEADGTISIQIKNIGSIENR